jgi:hypothetical protein
MSSVSESSQPDGEVRLAVVVIAVVAAGYVAWKRISGRFAPAV